MSYQPREKNSTDSTSAFLQIRLDFFNLLFRWQNVSLFHLIKLTSFCLLLFIKYVCRFQLQTICAILLKAYESYITMWNNALIIQFKICFVELLSQHVNALLFYFIGWFKITLCDLRRTFLLLLLLCNVTFLSEKNKTKKYIYMKLGT